MNTEQQNNLVEANINGIVLKCSPDQLKEIISSFKPRRAAKRSINGASMELVPEMQVVESSDGLKLMFKHKNHKTRSVSKSILAEAETLFKKNGGESMNKQTNTEFVFVNVDGARYPVGYNLIQAKNNAGF